MTMGLLLVDFVAFCASQRSVLDAMGLGGRVGMGYGSRMAECINDQKNKKWQQSVSTPCGSI